MNNENNGFVPAKTTKPLMIFSRGFHNIPIGTKCETKLYGKQGLATGKFNPTDFGLDAHYEFPTLMLWEDEYKLINDNRLHYAE